jgi:hypothetical protein
VWRETQARVSDADARWLRETTVALKGLRASKILGLICLAQNSTTHPGPLKSLQRIHLGRTPRTCAAAPTLEVESSEQH